MKFRDYMNEEAEMTIKFNRREKQKVLQALDSAGIYYTEMGDEEVLATFKNPVEAKRKIERLPVVVSYTIWPH